MIVKDNGKGQVTRRNVSVSWESVFKMLKNNICNTEFKVGHVRPFASYEGIYPKHNMLEGKSTSKMNTN